MTKVTSLFSKCKELETTVIFVKMQKQALTPLPIKSHSKSPRFCWRTKGCGATRKSRTGFWFWSLGGRIGSRAGLY